MQWVQGVMVRCVCTDGAGAVLVLLMVLSEAVPPVTVALPGVARGAAAGLKVRRAADGANAAADGSGGVLRLRNVASEGRRRFRVTSGVASVSPCYRGCRDVEDCAGAESKISR